MLTPAFTAGKRDRFRVALIVVAHLVLTLTLAAKLNLWLDEAYSLHTTSANAGYALSQALHFENQPPFYFLLLWSWRQVNDSVFFARLFSIVCAVAMLFGVASFSRRCFPALNPALPTALVAANPLIIGAAIDARTYALVLLLATLLFNAFYKVFWSADAETKGCAGFAVVAAAALYTQYYLGVLLVAFALVLLLSRRKQLPAYIASVAAAAALFAPMIPILHGQLEVAATTTFLPSSLYENVRHLMGIVLQFLFPLPPLPGHLAAAVWVCFLVPFAMCLRPWASRRSPNPRLFSVIVMFAAVGILITFTISGQPLSARYAAGLFVPTVFAAYAFLQDDLQRRQWAPLAWTLAAVTLSALTLFQEYRPMAKTGDWQRVAAFIMRNEKSDEPILVFEANEALPLAYYYHGQNVLVPVPQPLRFDTYDVRRNALRDESQIWTALRQKSRSNSRLWLVTTDYCQYLEVDFHCEVLQNFVAGNFKVGRERMFFHSRVRLLSQRKLQPLRAVKKR